MLYTNEKGEVIIVKAQLVEVLQYSKRNYCMYECVDILYNMT